MQRVGEDLRTHLPSGLASVWIQNSNTVTCGELCTLSPCPSAPHPWAMSQKNAPFRPRECVRDDVHRTTARHTGVGSHRDIHQQGRVYINVVYSYYETYAAATGNRHAIGIETLTLKS